MLLVRCLRSTVFRLDHCATLSPGPRPSRTLHTTAASLAAAAFPPRRPILDSDITENFLKGSGPGGQKINKTSSAVQLIHHPTGIVVKYQDTRSRELNRKRARRILQDRLEELELGPDARTRVKAREKSRKKASSGKKRRRKYRALEREKGGERGDAGEGKAESDGEGGERVDAGEEKAESDGEGDELGDEVEAVAEGGSKAAGG